MHIFGYTEIKLHFVKRHYVYMKTVIIRFRLPLNVLTGVQLIRSKEKH